MQIDSKSPATERVNASALSTPPLLAKVLAVKFPLLVTVIAPLLAKSAATILTLPKTVSVSLLLIVLILPLILFPMAEGWLVQILSI